MTEISDVSRGSAPGWSALTPTRPTVAPPPPRIEVNALHRGAGWRARTEKTLPAVRPDRLFRALGRLPARALLALLWLYQRTLSPALPVVWGPGCGCRFHPTCSHYAAGAVRTHGALAGAWLAARRLLRCHPLHPGGFDPVPARMVRDDAGKSAGLRPAQPVCRSVA